MSEPEEQLSFLSGVWRWIPDAIVESSPVLIKWRQQTAEQYALQAQQAEQANDSSKAIAYFSKAIQLAPDEAAFHTGLGRVYFKDKIFSRARECFQTALAHKFDDPEAWKGLGFTLDEEGEWDLAVYGYLKYLEQRPEDFKVHANLIEALAARGSYEDAIAAAERAWQRFPTEAGFPFLAGRCHFDAGNLSEAVRYLRKAQEMSPETAEIHRFLGSALATSGELKEALEQFQEAIRLDPANAYAHLNLSRLYDRIHRDAEYLQAAQSARQYFLERNDLEGLKQAYWEVGWAHYKLRHWEESVQASEAALGIDGSLAGVRFNLGLALLRLGKLDRASVEYQKALDLGDVAALKNIGLFDLKGALEEDPALAGAKEILSRLENALEAVTSTPLGTRVKAVLRRRAATRKAPVVVMGIAGSGKTTVGSLLAKKLGLPFIDADDLYRPEDRASMAAGVPLSDADKLAWLNAVAKCLKREPVVVACSALRRAHRDLLRKSAPQLRLVYLRGSVAAIEQRLGEGSLQIRRRPDIEAQFKALEPPEEPVERVLIVDINRPPEDIVASATAWYREGGTQRASS